MQIENICTKLGELYTLYENFIWKNDNTSLMIRFENNGIGMMFFEGEYVTEGFTITFKPEERALYEYIVVRLFLKVLGNVVIHNIDNVFYNQRHKGYVKFVVDDEILFAILKYIQVVGNENIITKDSDLIRFMYGRIPLEQRVKNDDLENLVDSYYVFTKRRLKEKENLHQMML